MKNLFLLILTVSVLSACSSSKIKSGKNEENFAIYISENGDIKRRNALIEGQPATANTQLAENDYVDNIMRNITEFRKGKPNLKVVIFIHGGLNTINDVWDRVNEFSNQMLREDRYPIFIGWNSGGVANYFDHLLRIRQGERYSAAAGWASSPFVLITDVARSVARIPAGISQAASDLVLLPVPVYTQTERDYQTRMNRIGGRFHNEIEDWEGSEFNVTSRGPFRVNGLWTKIVTYGSVVNPAKFLVAPLLDGFGSGAWDSMLRRTDLVLSKPIAFQGTIPQGSAENFGDTAVTTLLKSLEKQQRNEKNTGANPVRIDLIGHSMGTIVANNILARHPSLEIDNVVFMGAAAPVKDVENVVVPWLRRQQNTGTVRFYNLSIDQYRELSENFFWDFTPRGSLLRWIDTIFGEVNSFKDRTAGSWWNIIRAAEDVFPPDVRLKVHLTRFSIGGTEYGPQEHGQFGDYYFWRKEFWCAERGLSRFDPTLPPELHPKARISQDSACTTLKPMTAGSLTTVAK